MLTFYVLSFFVLVTWGEKPPIVLTPLGKIQGSFERSWHNVPFFAFEGVPYAHPPVSTLRFKAPEPVKPWNGTWAANTIYRCMQYNQYTPLGSDFVIGDEDCLYLNIYSPSLDSSSLLDVIVYIHGGAFMFNYAGFQCPDFIMDTPTVYISLNYRLGPLGFLTTEDQIAPGNFGLQDQILALKWIQDHIQYFGGNPRSVTLMGMSAGGASVHFHYLTRQSKDLFNRGVSQSGTMLNNWALMENGLEKTKALSHNLGCFGDNTNELVMCLRSRPAKQIVASVKLFQFWGYNPFSPFGVVVDTWALNPLLSDHPLNLIKNGHQAQKPWLVSYTNSEGLYPAGLFYHNLAYVDENWQELLPHLLDYNYTVPKKYHSTIAQQIRGKFLENQVLTQENFQSLVQVFSERLFVHDIRKTLKYQKENVYLYYFTHRGSHSKSESLTNTSQDFGASHTDDTAYVFKNPGIDVTTTQADMALVRLMLGLITSFAQSGKPKVGVEWPTIAQELVHLEIGGAHNVKLVESKFENEAFWDALPFEENERLITLSKDEL